MDASPQTDSEQFPLEIHACERKSNSGSGERQRGGGARGHLIMNDSQYSGTPQGPKPTSFVAL